VESCHLFADSLDELVSFATRIGCKPQWLHKPELRGVNTRPTPPHFDLTAARRARAVQEGATELTRQTLRPILAHLRAAYFPSSLL